MADSGNVVPHEHTPFEPSPSLYSDRLLADNAALSELPQTPASRTGDLWLCGKHWILCGDSTRMDIIERVLGGGLADMIFADLPYSVSYTGKTARNSRLKMTT